ncbi:hypothetical protein F5B17DRAFT_435706 [Nemania serpens]|nr:hypothetical protein F5B17DRAFT_435706 [Nemania serpens]
MSIADLSDSEITGEVPELYSAFIPRWEDEDNYYYPLPPVETALQLIDQIMGPKTRRQKKVPSSQEPAPIETTSTTAVSTTTTQVEPPAQETIIVRQKSLAEELEASKDEELEGSDESEEDESDESGEEEEEETLQPVEEIVTKGKEPEAATAKPP